MKVHLLKSVIDYSKYIQMEEVVLFILKAIEQQTPNLNPLYYAPNILLLACNLIELCIIAVKKYDFLSAYTEKIISLITEVTSKFVSKLEDNVQLRSIVFQKDFENRDSLDLISKYNLIDLMSNKNIEKIALELWTSDYDVKGNFMTTSSALKIVEHDMFNKPKDILREYFCLNFKNRKMNNFETHLYQFQVWKKSMKSRFIFEGLFVTLVALIFQYYLIDAIVASSTVSTSYSTFAVTATNAGYSVSSAFKLRTLMDNIINIGLPSSPTPSTPISTPSLPTSSPVPIPSLDLPIINGLPFNGDFSTLPTTSTTYMSYSNFIGRAYDFYVAMMVTVYLGFLAVSFSFRIPLLIAFAKKSKRKFEFLTINNTLDFLISVCFLTRIYLEYKYYHNGVDSQPNHLRIGEKYYKNVYNVYDAENFLSYLYSFISACIWLKVILLLRLTRFLGPLIKMIQNMIGDIAIFMVLYGIQLVFFASIGNLLFSSINEYSSLNNALKTLFGASLGSFSYDTLNGNNKGKVIGDVYITFFVICNTILLINLLVAILMTTYSQLENNKLACFINEILKLRSTMEYDSNCSSLVSTFPPWNGFAMLFVVPILCKKNSQTLNNVLFHIEYIPILVFLFAVYLLFNIVLLPFAYAKGLLVQLQSMKNTKLETSFCVRLLSLTVFAVFGPIVLVLNLAADIVCFFIHNYQSQDVINSKILENLK